MIYFSIVLPNRSPSSYTLYGWGEEGWHITPKVAQANLAHTCIGASSSAEFTDFTASSPPNFGRSCTHGQLLHLSMVSSTVQWLQCSMLLTLPCIMIKWDVPYPSLADSHMNQFVSLPITPHILSCLQPQSVASCKELQSSRMLDIAWRVAFVKESKDTWSTLNKQFRGVQFVITKSIKFSLEYAMHIPKCPLFGGAPALKLGN